jgi:multiple sugar transport system substrate-binding protein
MRRTQFDVLGGEPYTMLWGISFSWGTTGYKAGPRMSEERSPGRFSRRALLSRSLGLVPLATMAGLIAACAQPAAPAAPTASGATAPKAPSTEPVSLTFMSWSASGSTSRKVDMDLSDEYMKANPNVTIKTEDVPFNDYMKKLQTMFAADIGPDVLWNSIWRQPRFAQAKAIISLDDLAKNDASLPKYAPTALEMGKTKGVLYGLPGAASTWVLHYNSDLFKEAGLKNPAELKAANDWTWQRLEEAAVKIGKREGANLVTQGFMTDRQAYSWMAFAYNNNGVFVADDRTTFSVDTPGCIEALQFLADFVLKHKVSPTLTDQQGGDYVPRFSTGRLAMMFSWAGTAGDIRDVAKDKFQFDIIEPPPSKAGGRVGGYWHANLVNINSKSKSREHGWGLTKLVAGARAETMRVESGNLITPLIDDPTLIQAYKTKSPVKNTQLVFDLLKTPITLPYNENWEEQRFKVVEPYMAEVYDGKRIADSIGAINKQLNELAPK